MRATAVALVLASVAVSASAAAGVGAGQVTIDFSTYGQLEAVFDPDFYRAEGIALPAEQCGSAGCGPWWISWVQGDAALRVYERNFGPVAATFTRPVSEISLRVAPALQGTATYTLNAFAASGELVGSSSITVTEDFGDPANTGFGYVTIQVTDLPKPAKSFVLESVFVRSSYPSNTVIGYGISSISYRYWAGPN